MKKFLEEFKSFALRGNVMDMAVGVLIGGAFSGIVTSLTDNFMKAKTTARSRARSLLMKAQTRCKATRALCCAA